MDNNEEFQKAQATMDFVLKGLRLAIAGNYIRGVKVPLDHHLLIGKGTHSLVFKLPTTSLVGKCSFYETISQEEEPDRKGHFMLAGRPSGAKAYGLERTVDSLRQMGFDREKDIYLPEMQEYNCKVSLWSPKRLYYTLMPDLREGGKCQVSDAQDFDFASVRNGKSLQESYRASCQRILDAIVSGPYNLSCVGHGIEEDPSSAIHKMFLVQHSDVADARLVLSDLNHLILQGR